jgi:hypothetical protein
MVGLNSSKSDWGKKRLDHLETDDSDEILKRLNVYLILFEVEKTFYEDAYGLFLREKNTPFREISIFKHFKSNSFEVISRCLHEDNSSTKLFHYVGSKETCLINIKKIFLGFDQMVLLNQQISSFQETKTSAK